MSAAVERQTLRRAGMTRENSSCRLRVWYQAADVHRRLSLARVSAIRSSWFRLLRHVTGDALDQALLAAAQLNHIAIGVAYEYGDLAALAKADRPLGDRDVVRVQS